MAVTTIVHVTARVSCISPFGCGTYVVNLYDFFSQQRGHRPLVQPTTVPSRVLKPKCFRVIVGDG